jgi:hypothetical protein
MVGNLTESTGSKIDADVSGHKSRTALSCVVFARRQVLRLKMRRSRWFGNARRFSAGGEIQLNNKRLPFSRNVVVSNRNGKLGRDHEGHTVIVTRRWLYETARVSQAIPASTSERMRGVGSRRRTRSATNSGNSSRASSATRRDLRPASGMCELPRVFTRRAHGERRTPTTRDVRKTFTTFGFARIQSC